MWFKMSYAPVLLVMKTRSEYLQLWCASRESVPEHTCVDDSRELQANYEQNHNQHVLS